MLSARDFLGEDVYLAWLLDYEQMAALRNAVSDSGVRPPEEQIWQLRINKPWERFYAAVLK